MARRYGERRDTKCCFLSPDPLSFLSGLLNSRAEFPLRPGFLTGTSAVRYFPAPLAFSQAQARSGISPQSCFSRAQARSGISLRPCFLTGTSAACIFPATLPSHGHKCSQVFPCTPAFSRAQARLVFSPQPCLLTGTSAVSAASACERTALRNAKQQGAIATQSNGVERSPSGD